MFGQSRIDAVTRLHAALRTYYIAFQGRTQEGADGAKAPPKFPDKNYLLIQFQIRSILCFAVCTKKSVSQSLYNNRSYRWSRLSDNAFLDDSTVATNIICSDSVDA